MAHILIATADPRSADLLMRLLTDSVVDGVSALIEATRAALGDAAFAAGKALPLEQAVAEALAMPIPGAAGG
jgi:hypothetical protein